MKRIHIYLSLIILLSSPSAFSQKMSTDANVFGDVQCNGQHVPFVNITVVGTTIGALTDATGHFQLTNLPIGKLTIRVSGIGYQSQSLEVETAPNQTTEVKFEVEEDIFKMDEVVVSANRTQINRSEAPTVVTSISPKLLTRTQSVNIAEGLGFSPGLRTECNCQTCGFTQLRMNGLDGPYTQILLNSRPVFSGLAGVYGLELIPANMVERIEVVRGGGSALFGGNAIAGTVNIITREPQRNSFEVDGRWGVTGIGGNHGTEAARDRQLNFNTSLVTDDRKTGASLFGMLRDRDAYDENGDGFTESVLMENTTFGFSTYHKVGVRNKISLDGYRVEEFRRGGNKLDYLPHEADLCEQIGHRITGGNLTYDLFTNHNYDKLSVYAAIQSVGRDTYYGALQEPNAYGHTDDLTSVIGAQYVLNTEKLLKGKATTVFGIDNTNNHIDDRKLGANGRPNTILTKQMVNTLGSFVQHDWNSEKINLSLGLRYDHYMIKDLEHPDEGGHETIHKGVVVPRLSMLWKATPDLRFRIGYAKGYRAPQVFNEDLHIEMVNARRIMHFNDPDLIQETSHSLTASLNANFLGGSTINDVLIEGFYTKLFNPFADEYYELDTLGNWAYQRINAEDGAHVAGVNMEWNTIVSHQIEFQLGFTVQRSRFETPQAWGEEASSVSVNFMRTPDTYGYATLNWHPVSRFMSSLTFNYTGPMDVPHFGLDPNTADPLEQQAISNGDVITGERLERSEAFYIVDLLFSYDFRLSRETTFQVYAGMKNLFNQTQEWHDRGVFRDAGYIYGPCQPRTINLGLRIGNSL